MTQPRGRDILVDGVVAGQEIDDRLDAFADDLEDGLIGIEARLLIEKPDAVAVADGDLADIIRIQAGDDAEEGGFPRAVQAEDPELGPLVKAEGDIFEDLAARRRLRSAATFSPVRT